MRRGVCVLGLGLVIAAIAAPVASANFVYWPNVGGLTIGRVGLDGGGLRNDFIPTMPPETDQPHPQQIAIDSHYVYWVHGSTTTGAIGRAKLDGTGIQPDFIPHSAGLSDPDGIAVTATHIYWANPTGSIGRANIDGTQPDGGFIQDPIGPCGLATDGSFLYYTVFPSGGTAADIARVPIGGGTPDDGFIPVPAGKDCGVAVDSAHIYWGEGGPSAGDMIGRANLDGTGIKRDFVAVPGMHAFGVAVTSQAIFWGSGFTDHSIGRANLDGTGGNEFFAVAGSGDAATPYLLAASPSNNVILGPPRLNKKKGTATISAGVPGPGVLVMDQASNGTEAVVSRKKHKKKGPTVKRVQLTVSSATTVPLQVKAKGRVLRKLRRNGQAKLNLGITFTPRGVAGVPGLQVIKIGLHRRQVTIGP